MLHLKNICAGYGNGDILHDITFDLPLGQNLCILGPNGCGKSTLLRTISGLLDSRGELTLDGKPVARHAPAGDCVSHGHDEPNEHHLFFLFGL